MKATPATSEMNIYLTNHANVRNTTFTDDFGQVLYKSETPGSILSRNRNTTISKIVPNDSPDDMGVYRLHALLLLCILHTDYSKSQRIISQNWQS